MTSDKSPNTSKPANGWSRERMPAEQSHSQELLRLIAERLKPIEFPSLTRPPVRPDEQPTPELLNWGIQAYCFPWVRHLGVLIAGIVTLNDTGNRPAVRILGRSSFELCAHVYYVKKHLKQYLDSNDLSTAWKFLLPLASGSRYINEVHPKESELFPAPVHIRKVVNCFRETMPPHSQDDYSYLSEYCHPNVMAFMQHYKWTSPNTIEFMDAVEFGAFGAIAASSVQGLLAAQELLGLANDQAIRTNICDLLRTIAQRA